jgi:lysyl-tRNA synthetase class 2
LKREFFLRIAPEIPLKKLIVGGFEKIYEFARNFRNEGMDATHNPEFTGFELYQAYVALPEIMDLTENIFKVTAKKLDKTNLKFRGFDIDLTKPFKRISMVDIVKETTNIDFEKITSVNEALEIAKKHGIKVEEHQKTVGHILNLFFEKYGEETCIQPTFVHTYPIDTSPLTKKNINNPNFTDRFELFIGQKEFANAYSELNDPIEQLERFQSQMNEKNNGNTEA